ncbi:MAG: acyloxyacyl hydrolase [Candidatus Sulfotelmatobacter sp.]
MSSRPGSVASSQNKHAFSDTVYGRLYQLENRYSRLVYTGGPFAVRWVAEIVPMTLVGDPWHTKGRQYAYGGGGSPIGAQVNWVHYRRIEPFLTSGGGFLYFNQSMFHATHFNFTAQLGGGVQVFSSSHRHSFDVGCKYHHISNANLGNVNHGMDSLVLFAGVSFFR